MRTKARIEALEKRIAELLPRDDVVKCAKCGVLVCACAVVEGEPEIREQLVGMWGTKKYVYTPRYCSRCAPKAKSTKRTKG